MNISLDHNHIEKRKITYIQALCTRQRMIHNNNICYAAPRIDRKLVQKKEKLFWPRWPGSLRDSLVILKPRRESLLQQGK